MRTFGSTVRPTAAHGVITPGLPPDVCELLAEAVGALTFRVGAEVSGAWSGELMGPVHENALGARASAADRYQAFSSCLRKCLAASSQLLRAATLLPCAREAPDQAGQVDEGELGRLWGLFFLLCYLYPAWT